MEYIAQNKVRYNLDQVRLVGWLPNGENLKLNSWYILLHYFNHSFIKIYFKGDKTKLDNEIESIHKAINKLYYYEKKTQQNNR
jgi:hypothetical protein